MFRSNLRDIALELLMIDKEFPFYLKNPSKNNVNDFKLYSFEQIWGNTSGGFEGIGGSAMTIQRTYVFVPLAKLEEEDCLIFFGSRFAYSVPYSEVLKQDIKKNNVAGLSEKSKYDCKKE